MSPQALAWGATSTGCTFPLLLPLLLGCATGQLSYFHVEVELGEYVPTVAVVRWTSGHPVEDAWVHVETDWGESWDLDAMPGQSAVVFGLKPDRDVTVETWFRIGDETYLGDSQTITTGPISSSLPTFQVSGDAERALDGGLLLTTSVSSPGAALVLDGDGDPRWWYLLNNGLHIGRARLSVDGSHVLVMPVNNSGNETASLDRYDLLGKLQDQVVITGQHHDFVEHSDGTLAMLVHDDREVDGRTIRGDRLVEVAPDGSQTQIWTTWDDLAFEDGGDSDDGDSDDGDEEHLDGDDDGYDEDGDWTHANALVFDEAEQLYTIGLLGIRAIAAVERSGSLRWLLGSDDGDFFDGDGDPDLLSVSHQFEFLPDGLLLFENGTSDRAASRVVELAFDPAQPAVRERWSWTPDPALYSSTLGDVERLPSGDTLVDFSVAGVFAQVDPEGQEVWRLSSGLGGAFGYMVVLPAPDAGMSHPMPRPGGLPR